MVAVVSLLILAPSPYAMAQDVLKIVYNPGIAPLKFEDDAGQPAGLLMDIWRLWAEKNSRKIQFIKATSIKESLDLLKEGKVDLHAGLFKTKAREQFLEYSEPFLNVDYFIFTHPALRTIGALEGLSGLVIGTVQGGFTEGLIRSKFPAEHMARFKSNEDLFHAAQTGGIKVFIAQELSLLYYLNQNRLTNIFGYEKSRPVYSQVYYTASARGNRQLIEAVNEGRQAIHDDDRRRIEDKWILTQTKEIPADFAVKLTDEERSFLARTGIVTAHNESDWAPFNFNENGTAKGFSIDYIRLVAEKAGLEVRFASGPTWDEFLEMMKSGKLDIMLNIAKTPEREQYLAFTPSYLSMIQALYTRKDFPFVSSIEDMYGKRFAIPKGFYLIEVLKAYPEIDIVEVNNVTEAVHAVSVGGADALFDLMPVVSYVIDQRQITNLHVGGDIGIFEGKPLPLHIAVSKDKELLAGILGKAMGMVSDEEIRALQAKWLGKSIKQKQVVPLTEIERQWIQAHPIIRTSSEPDYAPFDFIENGQPTGFSVDYLKLVAARAGLQLQFVPATWEELVEKGIRKEIDLLHTIFKTPQRARHFLFTEPYKMVTNAIYINDKIEGISSVSDLAGLKVIVSKGDAITAALSRLVPDAVYMYRKTYEEILKDISLGKGDATVLDSAVANYLIRKLTLTNIKAAAEADIASGDRDPRYRLAIRSDWPILHSILQKAMDTVSVEDISPLEVRWFAMPGVTRERLKLTSAEKDWLLNHKKIRVMVGTWPPFHYMDGDLPKGLALDYVSEVLDPLGVEIEYVPILLADALKRISKLEKVDLLPTIAPSKEREELLNITDNYLSFPHVIFTQKDYPFIGSLMDLHGKTVAVEDNFISHKRLQQDHPHINLMVVNTSEEALKAVSFGNADAYVSNLTSGTYLIEKLGLQNLKVAAPSGYETDNQAMGVRKDWPELARIINKTLNTFTKEDHDRLRNKTFAVRFEYGIDWTIIWKVAISVFVLAGLIIGFIVTWNRKLAGEVAERKRAEEALTEVEERSRLLLDSAGEGIFGVDTSGKTTFINPAVSHMLGFSAEDLIGQPIHALIHHSYPDGSEYPQKNCPMAKAFTEGTIHQIDDEVLWRKDGASVPVEYHSTPIKKDDEIVGAVVTFNDITERKNTEMEIQEREKNLRTIYENSPMGMIHFDKEGTIINCNDKFIELMGSSREKLIGFNTPKQTGNEGVRAAILKALTGETAEFEGGYTSVTGGKANILRMAFNPTEPGTSPTEVITTVEDVSERVQMEVALKEREEYFRAVFDNAGVGIVSTDTKGRFIRVNDTFLEFIGYTWDEIKEMSPQDITHPDYSTKTGEMIQGQVSGEINLYRMETRYLRKDGNERWGEVRSAPIRDEEGALVASVTTITDVTERKRNEVEQARRLRAEKAMAAVSQALLSSDTEEDTLQKALKQLVAAAQVDRVYVFQNYENADGELCMRMIFEACAPGIEVCMTDHELNHRPYSKGLSRWEEELSHDSPVMGPVDSFPVAEQDVFKAQEALSVLLIPVQVRGEWFGFMGFEDTYLRRHWGASDLALFGTNAEIIGAFLARQQAEDEIREARDAAQDATRAKGDFLANMSHEIRTPMNAIIGMSHLALQTELTSKQLDYVNKIDASAKSLLGIINDILDFSKIEAGKLDMESVEFHLDDVLNNLSTLVGAKAQEKNLELLFSTSKDVPLGLLGDPLRVGQVLINLSNNAVKFTEKGMILVSTDLVERGDESVTLKFSVRDTGIGLTQEQIGKLFKAFSQADTSTTRKYGGTGLGLTISKRLVEMMGGEIWAESEPGQGSTFIFTAVFGYGREKERKILKPSPDLRGMKVLVVDDNDTSREILRGLLESMSFEVFLAASGEEGLTELKTTDPDDPIKLVIMDWKMPGMDGIATSRKIREFEKSLRSTPQKAGSWTIKNQQSKIQKIPIIMVTAYGREEIMRQAEKENLNGFLIKPVSQSTLFDTIMRVFDKDREGEVRVQAEKEAYIDAVRNIGGARILLAEDNEINQEVAKEILQQAGFTVEIANDGKEALEKVQASAFDAILMDIQMPVMDGFEATKRIREWEQSRLQVSGVSVQGIDESGDLTPDARHLIPIIAMTAHAMAGDREKSLEGGMNDHVTKPIDPDELFSALVKWIEPKEQVSGVRLIGLKRDSDPAVANAMADKQNSEVSIKQAILPASLPGISVQKGLKTVMGNEKLYRKLLGKFLESNKGVVAEIKEALKKEDMETAARLAHTVKGVAGNLGADELFPVAADLEKAIKQGETDALDALIDTFEVHLNIVLDGIQDLEQRQAAQRQTETPQTEVTIDIDAVKPLLVEMAGLLESDLMEAMNRLETLSQHLANSEVWEAFKALEKNVEGFDTDGARESLSKIATKLEIPL